ncbi:MAG TPA: FAD-dependent oxidoreductase, partial [Candidatus Limnocylindrales bacterium]|nr:FAD-dependent oxidoreductase [Candidatus Limnocylindrales bacterium]
MKPSPPAEIRHDLVLVGGGHTHVQVLRAWAMAPVPGVRVTVVVDRPVAVYSGMVPGFVAGQYTSDELEIDVRPLARRAGIACIVSAATGIDADARRLHLMGRPSLAYDTASFDVGSTVAGLELPGVGEHAIPTRPIGRFVERVDEVLARARGRASFDVVVVGGGAGGVELAFGFRARLEREGVRGARVLLLEAGPALLREHPAAARVIERE